MLLPMEEALGVLALEFPAVAQMALKHWREHRNVQFTGELAQAVPAIWEFLSSLKALGAQVSYTVSTGILEAIE